MHTILKIFVILRLGAKNILVRLPHFKPLLIISSGTFAAIIIVHGGISGSQIGYLIFFSLIALGVTDSSVGLLTTFPLLYTLPQTPKAIGFNESAYAIVLLTFFLREVISYRIFWLPRSLLRLFSIVGIIILVFVVLNLTTATANSVSLVEWARGIIPFVFILNFLPIFLVLRRRPELLQWLIISVGILMLLLTFLVITHYVGERLWEPQWYIHDGDRLRKISVEQAEFLKEKAIGPYLERVTQKIQKSTDALIPLAIIFGFLIFVLHRNRLGWLSLVGASFALVAIIMTYTRSMLLSCIVITIFIFFWLGYSRRESLKYAFLGGALLAFIGLSTITTFGMEGIYLHRILMLFKTSKIISIEIVNSVVDNWVSDTSAVPIVSEDPYEKDVNVITRLEEFRIAWSFFLEAPIIGKGIGIKHNIDFETTLDTVLKQRVGYIHNWPLYFLMVGGVTGFAIYTFILIGPIKILLRNSSQATTIYILLIWSIILLTVYGLYFAVFRLLSFNLLLAVNWGAALAARYPVNKQTCAA